MKQVIFLGFILLLFISGCAEEKAVEDTSMEQIVIKEKEYDWGRNPSVSDIEEFCTDKCGDKGYDRKLNQFKYRFFDCYCGDGSRITFDYNKEELKEKDRIWRMKSEPFNI